MCGIVATAVGDNIAPVLIEGQFPPVLHVALIKDINVGKPHNLASR